MLQPMPKLIQTKQRQEITCTAVPEHTTDSSTVGGEIQMICTLLHTAAQVECITDTKLSLHIIFH